MKATSKQILNSYKKKKHIPIEAGNYPVEQPRLNLSTVRKQLRRLGRHEKL